MLTPVAVVGRWSYGIYLVHMTVFHKLGVVLAGALLYSVVEKPFRSWSRTIPYTFPLIDSVIDRQVLQRRDVASDRPTGGAEDG